LQQFADGENAADRALQLDELLGRDGADMNELPGERFSQSPAGLLPAPRSVRLPQDVSVNSVAPRALSWQNRVVDANSAQNAMLQADIREALRIGATDIRVNQQQVNALGQRVGINRPDLQFTRPDGVRVYVEYDNTTPSTFPNTPRGPAHATRTMANDPRGVVILRSF
jgi:hypothetical protein